MRNLVVVSWAIAMLAGGSVYAADLKVKAPVKAPPPAVTWTGCYVGIEGGGKWDRVKTISNGFINGVPTPPAGAAIENPFDSSGVFAGGTLGCNYQVSSWVFGVEGDFSASSSVGNGQDIPPFNTTFQELVKERWLATARGRVGYLWDPNTLFFVTGGAAWSSFNTVVMSPPAVFGENDTVWGWTVGAGFEYMFPGTAWSAKAEYAYIQFASFNAFQSSPAVLYRNEAISEHLFRVGLNYHFGWLGGPVAAKY